ncbi:MAG: SpoIIE family protein phosphatase [Ruminococcus sp.]|nr:SpoIIE family protein phosphatase [Ruminococcus sp.]
MPKKSVREMSALERKHYSLEARVFHTAMLGSIILGVVSLLIGLGLYVYALAGQYIGEAFGLSSSTSVVVNAVADTESLSKEVMTIYHGLSDEERADPESEAYHARFAQIEQREDYQYLLSVLRTFRDSGNVYDLYIAVYDKETSALVYIADPEENEDYACPVGYWESVGQDEIDKFLNWNGEGKLYDIGNTDKYGWMCTAGVPLKTASGDITCFVLSDVTLDGLIHGARMFALQFFIATLIVMVVFALLLVRHMKKTIVRPINAIADAAESYASDKRSGADVNDHFAKLNIRTGDEIENLSLVMDDMERDLLEHEKDLTKITAEKERISTELSLATKIQADMLPNIYPAFPERPEFDIYAAMDPAKEVGGDFYDFFLVDDDHLCMVMADVSGKGVPAALFMMASKIILQNNAMLGKSPAQILTDTNAAICSNNREEMFVTVWLGILELSTGKLTAANAGHEYPVMRKANGQFELVKDKHGFVIGGMDGLRYKEYELQMEPGSKLFLYTDGVPEATDANQELFGTERMLEALNKDASATPEEILKQVRCAVDGFVNEAEQFDDLTMLCLEYKGGEQYGA